MTIISVRAPAGRIDASQRAALAQLLTDAVLIPEVGQFAPAARVGFQVHFLELPADSMAIGGVLVADSGADVITIDVAVMDGDWTKAVRAEVIRGVLAALAKGLGAEAPSPVWWVNFRVIEEGSWGSRGGVLSILDLLSSGAFSDEKVAAIRAAIDAQGQA